MKWENDVASGEGRGVRRRRRRRHAAAEGPGSLASVAYFSALPFPFGHAALTHLFAIPVYPTWLTRWLLAQPGTWRVLANERIMKRAVGRGRRRLKRQGDGLLPQN